ncbi:uncharacterized transmembrane protein DDB_G0289901 isoform X2 [Nasonia vitripennis]|uniref:Uncharacterized protein n=1 Tax=Nasonia vitripennis TaxID=7425 RepID=A0A7M7HEF6_NASVI|nr:uncharacterized transmembrane protein DDB_G0289901 isoform X2 [Nasonia vitripennis]
MAAIRATYLLALMLLVGTQLATSKSVDENFKDDQLSEARTLVLRKRDTNEESKDEEAATTTIEPTTTSPDEEEDEDEVKETTPAPVVTTSAKPKKTRKRQRPSTTAAPTTPSPDYEYEEEEEEDETPTVKPLVSEKEKPKSTKKPKPGAPQLFNRIKPEEEEKPTDKPAAGGLPASNLLPPMPFNNIPPAYLYPPNPAFAAPWGFNPLPASPSGPYDYPYPSGPAFSDSNVGTSNAFAGGFASASASASAGGSGGTVSTSTFPGSDEMSSVSNSGFPGSSGGVSSSGFPGSSSSSVSGSGNNGVTFSTSAFPGGSGASISASSSSFPSRSGGAPAFPNRSVSASSSFPSRSGGGAPQYTSEKVPGGKIEKVVSDSFIGVRGSFGPDDDESVAIEVDGPAGGAPGAGFPAYTNAGPNYGSISGPGYSASASFGNTPYANPYFNTIPTYNAYNPVDFQNLFQQYFANLQAQQQAFQQQLQAQIQAQQQAGGTFASGGAFITNDRGMVDPNAQVYVNTYSSPNSASSATSVNSRSGFGGAKSTVYASPFTSNDNNNRIWDQSNRVDSYFGIPSGIPVSGGSISTGPQSASASASLGPNGGFQAAQINPAAPGIFSRFGDSIPPPSGNSYGVFSSSSSSSAVGPDGKQTSRKSATIGVNDNGKVTYKTVHDP